MATTAGLVLAGIVLATVAKMVANVLGENRTRMPRLPSMNKSAGRFSRTRKE